MSMTIVTGELTDAQLRLGLWVAEYWQWEVGDVYRCWWPATQEYGVRCLLDRTPPDGWTKESPIPFPDPTARGFASSAVAQLRKRCHPHRVVVDCLAADLWEVRQDLADAETRAAARKASKALHKVFRRLASHRGLHLLNPALEQARLLDLSINEVLRTLVCLGSGSSEAEALALALYSVHTP